MGANRQDFTKFQDNTRTNDASKHANKDFTFEFIEKP